jgi:hypothetical protein
VLKRRSFSTPPFLFSEKRQRRGEDWLSIPTKKTRARQARVKRKKQNELTLSVTLDRRWRVLFKFFSKIFPANSGLVQPNNIKTIVTLKLPIKNPN